MFTIKDALHSDKVVSGYQREAIGEMDDCGRVDIINCIDDRIEKISEEMFRLDEIIKDNDEDDIAREKFYINLRDLGYLTLARQAAATCVVKHEIIDADVELLKSYESEREKVEKYKAEVTKLEEHNFELCNQLNQIKELLKSEQVEKFTSAF